MSAELVPFRERAVKPMAYAIGAVLLAGILLLALQDPIPVLGALIVACGVIAVMQFPVLALVVLLFVEPFHQAIVFALLGHAHIGVGSLFYWKDVVIIALFVRALVRRFNVQGGLHLPEAGDGLLIAYVAIYIAFAVASPPRSTVYPALLSYIEGPLLLLAIKWLRPSRKELWAGLIALLAAATVMGGAAIVERLGPKDGFQTWYGAPKGHFFLGATSTYRSASFLNDTLILGFYLAGAAPIAVAVSMIRSRWRPLALLSVAACTGGLICTITRSGYIGGGVGVLAVLLLTVRNPGIRLSLVGLVIVIAGAAGLYYASAGGETLVRKDSNTSHITSLKRDLNLLYERPLGYGLGTTDRYSYRQGVGRGTVGATESTYMAKALEGGVPALMVYVVALFVTMMRLRAHLLRAHHAGDRETTTIVAGALGAMIAIALAGLFLGIQELVVEVVLWGAAGIGLAWPIARISARARSGSAAESLLPVPSKT